MRTRVHQHSTPEFLQKVVESRPFTRQLDVIFADSEDLGALLSAARTSYHRSAVTFAEVFSAFDAKHSTLALTERTQDAWSIDPRAILTIYLTRDTYESLGIVGTPLGPPRRSDMFLVTLDLHDSSRQAMRARECLRQWDARRAEAGKDKWDVLLSSPLPSAGPTQTRWEVSPFVRLSHGVRIPSSILPSIKSEDSHEELSTLFEWVGLACLRSQRLDAHDAPNPYVASCSFPTSWHTGSLTHVQWTGLLMPGFVQSVLDTCLRVPGLVAITAAPVFHEGRGTWTFVMSKESSLGAGDQGADWVLAECSE